LGRRPLCLSLPLLRALLPFLDLVTLAPRSSLPGLLVRCRRYFSAAIRFATRIRELRLFPLSLRLASLVTVVVVVVVMTAPCASREKLGG
jgi:hypothetical protein